MTLTMESPTQLLADYHKRIRGLFRQAMVLDQRAHEMLPGIAEELFLELSIHGEIHKRIVNPALVDVLDMDGRGRVMNTEDLFRDLTDRIDELKKLSTEAEFYQTKMADLRKSTELLFEEEERFLHPKIEQLLQDRFQDLAEAIRSLREKILSDPRNQSARAYFVQNPNGGEHKRKLSA